MSVERWGDYVAFRRRALQRMAELASLQEIKEPSVIGAVAAAGQPRGGLLVLRDADPRTVIDLLQRSAPV